MEKKIKTLRTKATLLRKLIIKMLAKAKSGHPGGSLSSAEIITCLYFEVMRHDPKNPEWSERDRFHLSKGHCCQAVYAALTLNGYFPEEELWNLRQVGALLQGHPQQVLVGCGPEGRSPDALDGTGLTI